MNSKPNVIFMIADDHRFSEIQALHNPLIKTPNFDQLVAKGTSFLNMNIMGGQYRAVCSPSRACVHTGGHVFKAVANDPEPEFDDTMNNHTRINPEMALMPEAFKQEGYHTHAIGKWHNDQESFTKGFISGKNLFFGGMSEPDKIPLHQFQQEGNYKKSEAVITEKNATEIFCDAGVDFIESYDEESPFFLYMAFTSPHDPRTAPKRYAELYDPGHLPLPKNFMSVHPFDNGEMHVRDEGLARLPRDPQEICQHIADYYAMISQLDAEIGRILDTLEDKGIAENTIVVYTSDHGLAVGQHGLMGKQNLYEHSIRIPFVISGQGIAKGKKVNNLTSQMDIFPTLCELTNILIPKTVNGKSMLSLIRGQGSNHYESVFALYKDVQRMVKNDTYKLIRYYRSNEREIGTNRTQLFNHDKDPWETNDLVNDPGHIEIYHQMMKEMEQWQIELNDPLLNER